MAPQRAANNVEKKRRSKKRKTRTEVSSSSESDSDGSSQTNKEALAVDKKDVTTTIHVDQDVQMEDAPASPPAKPAAKAGRQTQDDFSAIYLRKVAAEFADDLDKVREAQDFKASSVPMLIHALKQGESLFSGEERRRVVRAAQT